MKTSDFLNHNFYFISYPGYAGGTHLRNLISLDKNFYPVGAKSHDEYFQYLLDWYKNPENISAHIAISQPHHHFSSDRDIFLNYLDVIDFEGYKKSVHCGHAMDFILDDILDIFLNRFLIVLTLNDQESCDLLRRREMLIKKSGYYSITDVNLGLEQFLYSRWHYMKNVNFKDNNIFEFEVHRLFNPNIQSVIDNINQVFGSDIPLNKAQEIHTLWYNKLWI